MTISATCTWRAAGSSKVELMTSPRTVHVRVVGGDRGGDLLHHHCLARLRLGDDERALALALRCHQVEDAAGDVFRRTVAALQGEATAREQRGQVLEQHLVLRCFDRLTVDGVDDVQREVAFAILREADAAGDVVSSGPAR
ncbi:hypothetical protein G6F32_014916 [Rhizopus arrhizus]|nr:hypothetical protein G6F32_014916 [Rhizopus arrhizus]